MSAGDTSTADLIGATVDERNPWLGLASFTEETREFFHGRDEEVAELARRVQRKLLTVLFGMSGLGKTSILRAGLVPRLRAQGYCPIYVRIDYSADAPAPAEQIKRAIAQTARHAGEWTQSGVAVEGETLWEFLHHRDDVLRDEAGETLIPLIIFDQFEEIFTLAQSDEQGRARAARFVEELADLVENRPPRELEERLNDDDSAAERFDFSRGDYRVLIALREDYLAPLEGLKKSMPSIAQNRLRLAPMTGTQALAAVLQPGRKLVSEEVAAAIVRFVAGGAELANAEVEPSLLSLICRELNDARIAQGRAEISLDLLAGSHATILSNFYERALSDQPPAVRQIIEDELLTSSGYRENVGEERIVGRFQAVGADPRTLAVLVNRRLLRIEERLDLRRVELTHDVLCSVVKQSRDLRREREAREETERVLDAQRQRELAARHALVRARQIAVGCTMLAVVAVAAAGFAFVSSRRAHRAEQEAQETRRIAERARAGAEHLLGYLSDDFVRELDSFGRLNVIAEFTQRQIDYFHGLPVALQDVETCRNGALAMIHNASVMRALGKLDDASHNANEGVQILEQLRSDGDSGEPTLVALGIGYSTQGMILDTMNDPGGLVATRKAVALLRPVAEAKDASVPSRRAYVGALVRSTYEKQAFNDVEGAIRDGQLAMKIAWELGARDLSNLQMGAYYAESGAWTVSALVGLGRNDDARRIGGEAMQVADRVLEQRPGFRLALHAQQIIESVLGSVALNDLNPEESLKFARLNLQTSQTLLRLDPNNTVSNNNMGVAHQGIGDALWQLGRVHGVSQYYADALKSFGQASVGGAGYVMIRSYSAASFAYRVSMTGDFSAADAIVASGVPFLGRLRETELPGSLAVSVVEQCDKIGAAGVELQRGNAAKARELSADATLKLKTLKPQGEFQANQVKSSLQWALYIEMRAAYLMGDFPAAERFGRESMVYRKSQTTASVADRRDLGELSTWIAASLARQGKMAEAEAEIAPLLKMQREFASHARGDRWLPVELASALYVEGLTQGKRGRASLENAAALLDALPSEMRAIHDVQLWRERVREAQRDAG